MNVMDMILQAQSGGQIEQMARTFGIEPAQAQAAVGQLLPGLAAGVKRNMASEAGLGSLAKALQTGDHQKYLDQPEILGEPQTVAEGNAILGHILGSKDASRSLAEQAHGQTGLDTGIIKQMLPMVASMLMGSLSKQASSAGLPGASASGLTGMLTSLLDADKDGSVVDDLMGMAGKLFR